MARFCSGGECMRRDLEEELELLRALMELLMEMPIKHPQQATRRDILYRRCQQFGIVA